MSYQKIFREHFHYWKGNDHITKIFFVMTLQKVRESCFSIFNENETTTLR